MASNQNRKGKSLGRPILEYEDTVRQIATAEVETAGEPKYISYEEARKKLLIEYKKLCQVQEIPAYNQTAFSSVVMQKVCY